MPDEFKIGDRVEHVPYPLNTLYKPGPGTVTNVSPTRVVVLWGRRCDRSSRNSRNRCTRPRTIAAPTIASSASLQYRPALRIGLGYFPPLHLFVADGAHARFFRISGRSVRQAIFRASPDDDADEPTWNRDADRCPSLCHQLSL